MEKLDELAEKIRRRVEYVIQFKEHTLKGIIMALEALSPLSILSRGYSMSFSLPGRKLIFDASALTEGEEILTRVKRGSFTSIVKEIKETQG